MRLKGYVTLVASVTTLVLGVLTLALIPRSGAQTGAVRSPEAPPVTDSRERVRLAPTDRDTILLEMRTMLQGLGEILHGLASGDLVKAERAARGSGVASAIDARFEQTLPAHFFQLGMRTHQRFDALAAAIKAGATRDDVVRRLAAVTASCVTCHATYRLDETPQ
jgi:cytochrome c556